MRHLSQKEITQLSIFIFALLLICPTSKRINIYFDKSAVDCKRMLNILKYVFNMQRFVLDKLNPFIEKYNSEIDENEKKISLTLRYSELSVI